MIGKGLGTAESLQREWQVTRAVNREKSRKFVHKRRMKEESLKEKSWFFASERITPTNHRKSFWKSLNKHRRPRPFSVRIIWMFPSSEFTTNNTRTMAAFELWIMWIMPLICRRTHSERFASHFGMTKAKPIWFFDSGQRDRSSVEVRRQAPSIFYSPSTLHPLNGLKQFQIASNCFEWVLALSSLREMKTTLFAEYSWNAWRFRLDAISCPAIVQSSPRLFPQRPFLVKRLPFSRLKFDYNFVLNICE